MSVGIGSAFVAFPAAAVPSFARQTEMPCTGCHVGAFGPQLNDYGRKFKLNGYVWGDAKVTVPALSAMMVTAFTSTAAGQPGGAAAGFRENDNVSFDQASLFYAGRILSNVGAMIQGTYDGIAKQFTIDNVDIRFAKQATLANLDVVYGVSLNNNPTAQDIWNTTPAWGYPFAASNLAPSPTAATLIDGGLAQQVVGLTTYSMWNDLLYVEGGIYATLPKNTQSGLGVDPSGENQIKGAAPYWRLALQHQWGSYYVSAGTFGLDASVYPGRDRSEGTDHYRDVGIDLTLQVDLDDKNTIVAGASTIHETQSLLASNALGLSNNPTNRLNSGKVTATYDYAATYGLTASYFDVWGSTDGGLYSPDPVDGSNIGKPNSNGFQVGATYTPFGKDDSWLSPWLNLRLGLQYVAYLNFNGARTNYDGFGRTASDNNTLFAYAWLAF